jgi:hypothetical protein
MDQIDSTLKRIVAFAKQLRLLYRNEHDCATPQSSSPAIDLNHTWGALPGVWLAACHMARRSLSRAYGCDTFWARAHTC